MEITLSIALQSESVKTTQKENALDRWITKVSKFLSNGKSFAPNELKSFR